MLGAEISYDRIEFELRDARTGEPVPLAHDAVRQRNHALRERDLALRQREEEREAHEAALERIAELEARLSRR